MFNIRNKKFNYFSTPCSSSHFSMLHERLPTFPSNIRSHSPSNLNPRTHHCENLNLTQQGPQLVTC